MLTATFVNDLLKNFLFFVMRLFLELLLFAEKGRTIPSQVFSRKTVGTFWQLLNSLIGWLQRLHKHNKSIKSHLLVAGLVQSVDCVDQLDSKMKRCSPLDSHHEGWSTLMGHRSDCGPQLTIRRISVPRQSQLRYRHARLDLPVLLLHYLVEAIALECEIGAFLTRF